MTPRRFRFDGSPETFNGWDDGTTWNGAAAPCVDVATLCDVARTVARLAREAGQDGKAAAFDVLRASRESYHSDSLFRIDGLILEWVDE